MRLGTTYVYIFSWARVILIVSMSRSLVQPDLKSRVKLMHSTIKQETMGRLAVKPPEMPKEIGVKAKHPA